MQRVWSVLSPICSRNQFGADFLNRLVSSAKSNFCLTAFSEALATERCILHPVCLHFPHLHHDDERSGTWTNGTTSFWPKQGPQES
jgi:hypothetical protein